MIEYEKLFLDDELCRIITWNLNAKDNKVIILKDALYYLAKELNRDKKLDLIYSDEDKIDFKVVNSDN